MYGGIPPKYHENWSTVNSNDSTVDIIFEWGESKCGTFFFLRKWCNIYFNPSTTLQKMCQIHGSVLASVESQEEHNYIVSLMQNTHSEYTHYIKRQTQD